MTTLAKKKIYQDKNFAKNAVSGRHRGINSIFVKHNLYHQSKWSRTIDFNTTHIILFNSPRDTHQIEYLGRQLNKAVFLKEVYTDAVAEPHGHLLIDLDPKTSECLRFCSNIEGPGPTKFYLPSSQAKLQKLTMSEKKLHTFSLLEKLTSIQQQKLLRHCDKEFLRFCCECAINVVNGTVGINVDELKQYEIQLRLLCKRSTSNKERRKILMSPKGLKLLNFIIRPCFCYLTD